MLRRMIESARQIVRRLLRDAPPRYVASALLLCLAPLALTPWAARSDTSNTWKQLGFPGGRHIVRIVDADSQPQYLYALSSSSGLHVSFDAGQHWQRASLPAHNGLLGISHAIDIAVCPQDPSQVYLLLESLSGAPRPMIYYSSDAGASWRAQSGLGPTRVRGMTFGDSCDDLVLVTLADVFQAFISRDGDTVFVPNQDALQEGRLAAIEAINSVTDLLAITWPDQDGTDRHHLFVATPDQGLRAYVALDNGTLVDHAIASDELSTFVRNSASVHAVCADPMRAGLVCIGTDAGMFASMDAGETWFPTAYALRHERVLSLLMDTDSDIIFAGLAGGGVFRSTDNGATWEQVGRGLNRHSVYSMTLVERSLGDKLLIAGTSDGIYQLSVQDSGLPDTSE